MKWLEWQQLKEQSVIDYRLYQAAMSRMVSDQKIIKQAYEAAFALLLISLYELFPDRADEIDNCFDIYCGMLIIHG